MRKDESTIPTLQVRYEVVAVWRIMWTYVVKKSKVVGLNGEFIRIRFVCTDQIHKLKYVQLQCLHAGSRCRIQEPACRRSKLLQNFANLCRMPVYLPLPAASNHVLHRHARIHSQTNSRGWVVSRLESYLAKKRELQCLGRPWVIECFNYIVVLSLAIPVLVRGSL